MSNEPTTSNREPLKVVADILMVELGLDLAHVVTSDQRYEIPNDDSLFVEVGYLGPSKAIGNNNYLEDDGSGGAIEVQEVTMRHVVNVELMSFSNAARIRKEEALMALRSIYSQQQQERYLIQIARVPEGFVNASAVEESARLKRYVATVVVTALHRKVKPVNFYDKYNDGTPFTQLDSPEVKANA